MAAPTRPLAIVTGASSGIGYALATCCAAHGFDLLIAADEPAISDAARGLRTERAQVEAIEADLTTLAGVDRLYAARHGRPVEALLANAGHGLGHGFLDQDFNAVRHVIDTNIAGTLSLIRKWGATCGPADRPHPLCLIPRWGKRRRMIQQTSYSVMICLVLTMALVACAGDRTSRSTGQAIDDNVIAAKVKTALVADPDVKGMKIDVDVNRGVIQLQRWQIVQPTPGRPS